MSVEERLSNVFREVFELNELPEKSELIYNQFPKWNSLGHMSLVAAIETEFDCILETDDILAMSSFQRALEIVSRIHGSA
jgi:acyl carrier protein